MTQQWIFVFAALAAFGATPAGACTDFSGFWQGACTETNYPGTDSVVLAWQQFGCASYRDGTTPNAFGGSTTSTWVNAAGNLTTTRTMGTSWNSDQSVLDATVTLYRVDSATGNILDGSETGTVELVNNQLVLHVSGTLTFTVGGVSTPVADELTCTYDKVADIRHP